MDLSRRVVGKLALHPSARLPRPPRFALEKLSRVKLLDGPCTAPNHSRPASCMVDVDIDADDQP